MSVVAHKTKHPYITKEKGVQGGRPIIVGTRIPVSTIIIWYKAGKEIYEILSMYPQLSPSQLHDALSYYYDHKKEIEIEITLMQDEIRWQKNTRQLKEKLKPLKK